MEGGGEFSLSLANPNPTSSKGKDGPRYRVSFELSQEEWLWFQDAHTTGMIIEATCVVSSSSPRPRQQIGYRLDAIRLSRDEDFQDWILGQVSTELTVSPEKAAAEFIKSYCGVNSRSELDAPEASESYRQLLEEYRGRDLDTF